MVAPSPDPAPVTRSTESDSASSSRMARLQDRVYYGWWIVAITFAGTFFTTGIHDTVFSVMLKPMSEDLGWSRTQISAPISLSIWVGALLAPLAGRFIDRHGARFLTSGGALIIGTVFALLSSVGQLWHFWLVYPAGRATSQMAMIGNAPATVVSNWFVRRRGRALGIQAMAIGVGGASLSLLAQFIMSNWGWRTVFVVFAIGMWVFVMIPAALIIRRRPEDIGLLPDGDTEQTEAGSSSDNDHSGGREVTSVDFTVRDALRSPAMWSLIGVSFISSTGTGAIHLHLASYLTDTGSSAAAAAAVVSVSALMGAMGSLVWGSLSERIAVRKALIVIYLISSLAVLMLALYVSTVAAFAFAVFFGLATRGGHVVLSLATADYFGRANLGTISGFILPMQVAGLGIGQLFAPIIRDQTGSYQLAFIILAVLYAFAAIVGATVRPPRSYIVAQSKL